MVKSISFPFESNYDITSSLIGDSEAVHVHASNCQLFVQLGEHVFAQHPRAGQNPGVIDVENADVVRARVDQSVGLVVCGQNPVRRIWKTFEGGGGIKTSLWCCATSQCRHNALNLITFPKADLQNRRLWGIFNFGNTLYGIYLPVRSLQQK